MSLTLDVILGGPPVVSHFWPRRALLVGGTVGLVVYSDDVQPRRPRRARVDFPLAG